MCSAVKWVGSPASELTWGLGETMTNASFLRCTLVLPRPMAPEVGWGSARCPMGAAARQQLPINKVGQSSDSDDLEEEGASFPRG